MSHYTPGPRRAGDLSYVVLIPRGENLYQLSKDTFVDKPLADVFEFFSHPDNLERLTPPSLGFRILTPPPLHMRAGAVYDYYVTVRGIPMRWTTLISDYEPP